MAAGYGQSGYPGMAPAGPEVMAWFQAVDTDRTGKISAIELQQALTNANWSHFNAETCRLMIGMFDTNHSGQIDVNEFQALWNYIHQWRGVFDMFDRDKSGAIDASELNNAFTQMGYRLSPAFSHLVLRKYDTTGMQRLTLDNFIQASVLLKSLTDQFRAKDTSQQGIIQISYDEFMTMCMLNKP